VLYCTMFRWIRSLLTGEDRLNKITDLNRIDGSHYLDSKCDGLFTPLFMSLGNGLLECEKYSCAISP
jgi:hypothetical protein